jgi:hypothetical protein
MKQLMTFDGATTNHWAAKTCHRIGTLEPSSVSSLAEHELMKFHSQLFVSWSSRRGVARNL